LGYDVECAAHILEKRCIHHATKKDLAFIETNQFPLFPQPTQD